MEHGNVTAVPEWLESLLATTFFSGCSRHKDGARTERNMFCLDCGGAAGAFCFYCRSARHDGHAVIQIRRSSYHDVVRVAEVEGVLEMKGVQTYVINSARVVFLNERPQPKGAGGGGGGSAVAGGGGGSSSSGKGVVHLCEICGRSLLDPCRFCSLGCKLVRIRRNGDASFKIVSGDDGEEEAAQAAAEEEEEEGMDKLHEDGKEQEDSNTYESPPPSPAPSSPPPPPRRPSSNQRRRSRKGIPLRAPFFAS